jgi:hypothetical protein
MIDPRYGRLARDGREHAIRLPDTLTTREEPGTWTSVDVEAKGPPATDRCKT